MRITTHNLDYLRTSCDTRIRAWRKSRGVESASCEGFAQQSVEDESDAAGSDPHRHHIRPLRAFPVHHYGLGCRCGHRRARRLAAYPARGPLHSLECRTFPGSWPVPTSEQSEPGGIPGGDHVLTAVPTC